MDCSQLLWDLPIARQNFRNFALLTSGYDMQVFRAYPTGEQNDFRGCSLNRLCMKQISDHTLHFRDIKTDVVDCILNSRYSRKVVSFTAVHALPLVMDREFIRLPGRIVFTIHLLAAHQNIPDAMVFLDNCPRANSPGENNIRYSPPFGLVTWGRQNIIHEMYYICEGCFPRKIYRLLKFTPCRNINKLALKPKSPDQRDVVNVTYVKE